MIPINLRNSSLHDHLSLIEHIASWLRPERYLEIGIYDGVNLKRIQNHCKECYGVDVILRTKNYNSNVKLFEMTSDKFFSQLDSEIKFDMIFIDGDHNKHQVYKDFINSKDRVIDDGLILLHDTVPMDEHMLDPILCENAWEAVLKIKNEFSNNWEILSLPFNPGITIMRKIPITKQLIWK